MHIYADQIRILRLLISFSRAFRHGPFLSYHFYLHLDEEPISGADIEALNVLSTPGRPVYFNHVGKTDLLQVK